MDIARHIREGRLERGLSQQTLASRAKVSLPSLQRIESGAANPSVRLVTALYEVLGLTLKTEPIEPDWDELAALGVPLARLSSKVYVKNRNRLLIGLDRACWALSKASSPNRRHKEAVAVMLETLHRHYSSVYQTLLASCPKVENLRHSVAPGRSIKLQRIVRDQLGNYL